MKLVRGPEAYHSKRWNESYSWWGGRRRREKVTCRKFHSAIKVEVLTWEQIFAAGKKTFASPGADENQGRP